jgi:hypothetical protein
MRVSPRLQQEKESEDAATTAIEEACESLNEKETLDYLVYDRLALSHENICFTIGEENLSYLKAFDSFGNIKKPILMDYSIINHAVNEIFKNPKLTDISVTVKKSNTSFDMDINESVLSRKSTKFESITIGEAYSENSWRILSEHFEQVEKILFQYNSQIDHATAIAAY